MGKDGWLGGKPIELGDGWLADSPEGEPYIWRPVENKATGIVHALKFHASRTIPSTSHVGGHIYNHTLCRLSSVNKDWGRMEIMVVGTPISCPECIKKLEMNPVKFFDKFEVVLTIRGEEWTCVSKSYAFRKIEEILSKDLKELTKGISVKDAEQNVTEVSSMSVRMDQ